MIERWGGSKEITDACKRFQQAIAGYRRPAAFGIAELDGVAVSIVKADFGDDPLPAVVVATVVGHSAGTASYPLSQADLAQAIELLAAAEPRVDSDHPHLAAWRWLLGSTAELVVVFVGDLTDRSDDSYACALLAEAHRGRHENPDGTTTLWRPTGPTELDLVRAGGWKAWPQRLPDQPIFYPVLNEAYAATIAQDWNVDASGTGYVTRFAGRSTFARRYPTRQAGGIDHLELWIPAEDIDAVNANIVGEIEVVGSFGAEAPTA